MADPGTHPVLVVGGSVAALVAADALSGAGREVRLLLPAKGVGGGFAPMRRDGRRLELGVRVLELGYEDDDTPPALDTYVPGFGGHRAFTPLLRRWVQDLVGDRLHDVADPRMALDGAAHDDVYFTVDLTPLPGLLGPDRLATVAGEAADALAARGDAGVLADPAALERMTLEEASRANHGDTLHDTLIAPVADKFLADGSARTLAAWRRKVWMPLFWPRTVKEACNGGPAFRPARRFETVGDEGPGAVLDALLARLRARDTVTIETAGPVHTARTITSVHGTITELDVDGVGTVTASRPILGLAPRELFAAVGHDYAPERARSVIAWLEVPREEPIALTHVVDADNPVVRVSDSGAGAAPGTRVLCVELRHDLQPPEIATSARDGLRAAGLLEPGLEPTVVFSGAMDTFDAPTADTRDAHAAALDHLDAAGLDALVVGGASAPGADSFNEQVVAGLAAAEARR